MKELKEELFASFRKVCPPNEVHCKDLCLFNDLPIENAVKVIKALEIGFILSDIKKTSIWIDEVKTTERGWAGHFICSHQCLFRRNTLIEYKDIKIVVSTVGNLWNDNEIITIGYKRYYETMAFHADEDDKRYFDADVSRQVYFDSNWSIDHPDADDKANQMHETVVNEIIEKLKNNEI